MIYDLIIIGMGPAGMSAAVYAKRNGLNILMLEKYMPGGLVNITSEVDNYLGFMGENGPELSEKFMDHIKKLDIKYLNQEVIQIIAGEEKKVITKKEEFTTKKIIIATGRSPKALGLPNEKELYGKGISSCALCDGFFFKEKIVAVIGGGNSALEEAVYLSKLANKVYLIHRRDSFRGEQILKDKINEKENIEILYESQVTKINAVDDRLSSIEINNAKEIQIDGMFIYIGYQPSTNFVNGLIETDENGYIIVDDKYQTNIEGIYAVGDIIPKEYYQIVTAVSDGAVAALNINKTL